MMKIACVNGEGCSKECYNEPLCWRGFIPDFERTRPNEQISGKLEEELRYQSQFPDWAKKKVKP